MDHKIEYSSDTLIISINPRVPFTKLGVYNNNKMIFLKNIKHSDTELSALTECAEQTDYRSNAIIEELKSLDIDLNNVRAVVTRGGLTKPLKSGVYEVNEQMILDLVECKHGKDVVNLGALIVKEIIKILPNAIPLVADPVTVDEYHELSRVTGLPEIERRSIFHALNQKSVGRKYAKSMGKSYEEMNLIVAHMGTGITVSAHKNGRVIDSSMGFDGDGSFSPTRAGSLPAGDLVRLCFSGKYTQEELLEKISNKGGLMAHLGTPSALEVDRRISEGDEKATFIFEAMAYQVSKAIGTMIPVLKGKVDALLITGAIAESKWFVDKVMERVGNLYPVSIYPGADEMEILALKGLDILNGEEEVLEYK
jgi:butyrate kinase